jgi:hypothetical protein
MNLMPLWKYRVVHKLQSGPQVTRQSLSANSFRRKAKTKTHWITYYKVIWSNFFTHSNWSFRKPGYLATWLQWIFNSQVCIRTVDRRSTKICSAQTFTLNLWRLTGILLEILSRLFSTNFCEKDWSLVFVVHEKSIFWHFLENWLKIFQENLRKTYYIRFDASLSCLSNDETRSSQSCS